MKRFLIISLISILFFSCSNKENKVEEDTKEEPIKVHNIKFLSKLNYDLNPLTDKGLINSKTTLEEIIKVFGSDNIENKSTYIDEGVMEVATTLIYPKTNYELRVIWEKEKPYKKIMRVELLNENNIWTVDGIAVGTSIQKLNDLNKKIFTFYGFDWDYGGHVFDWNEGELSKYDKKVNFILSYRTNSVSSEVYDQSRISGDGAKVMSDHEILPQIKTYLSGLRIIYYDLARLTND